MKYIIGNWKSNKDSTEVNLWFAKINELFIRDRQQIFNDLKIIVCPSFVYLPLARKLCDNYKLPLSLGAQDVSPFKNGAYTGEVSASMIAEFAEYVIIGHSERRSYFHEDDKILAQKVDRVKEVGLTPIYCIPKERTSVPAKVNIVAYEPVWAIGTGKSDTPQRANHVALVVKQKYRDTTLIYGGSVAANNARSFLAMEQIDGVLPGGASLDPLNFWEIIVNASTI